MAKSRKAPPNTYWRDGTLWGRITVKGREIRFSLRTDDAEVAASRVKARREREIAAAHFGDQRPTWEDAVLAWGEHIAASVKPSTAKRYAVSLKQLEPFLLGAIPGRNRQEAWFRRSFASGEQRAPPTRPSGAICRPVERARLCGGGRLAEDNPALKRLRKVKERHEPIVLPEHGDIARVIARAPGLFGKLIEAALADRMSAGQVAHPHAPADRPGPPADHPLQDQGGPPRAIDLSPAAYALFQSLPVCMTFGRFLARERQALSRTCRAGSPPSSSRHTKVGTGFTAVPLP